MSLSLTIPTFTSITIKSAKTTTAKTTTSKITAAKITTTKITTTKITTTEITATEITNSEIVSTETTTTNGSSILQPLSTSTLTDTVLLASEPVAPSFTIPNFSNSSIIETLFTSSAEEVSSTSITEISQSSYSGKPFQTVSTSVDPFNTSQAAGISFQTTGNRSHLLSVLLPTLIVGLFIVCSILWILCYKYKPLSQSRHRLCITSYPPLIQRTQDNRQKTDFNGCNCDAQGYDLQEVSTDMLTDGERLRRPLTTLSHSQFMVEGLRRQNGSSMTLFDRYMEYSTLREPAHGSPHSPVYMELVYFRDHLDGIPESPPSYQESARYKHPAAET